MARQRRLLPLYTRRKLTFKLSCVYLHTCVQRAPVRCMHLNTLSSSEQPVPAQQQGHGNLLASIPPRSVCECAWPYCNSNSFRV